MTEGCCCCFFFCVFFIHVVPGKHPNPEWPHHISHSRLGERTADLKVCVRHNTEAAWLSQDESAEKFPQFLKKRAQFNIVCRSHALNETTCTDKNVRSLLQVLCQSSWNANSFSERTRLTNKKKCMYVQEQLFHGVH